MSNAVVDAFADPDTRECPYKFYQQLRDESPIFYSDYLGAYVVTRFADVRYVVEHAEIFSSNPPTNQTKSLAKYASEFLALYVEANVPPPMPTLVVTDGKVHQRYRNLANPSFSPVGVRKLEPLVKQVTNELLDEFIAQGDFDLYRNFCLKLPLYIICDVLGLPRSGVPIMQRAGIASVRLAAGAGENAEGLLNCHRDIVAFQTYLLPFITAARAERPRNLLGDLVHNPTLDGDLLDDREVLSVIQVLNVGGNETTTNGIGNMLEKILTDKKLEARLRADRSLIPNMVEEAVRLESPVCGMPRWVLSDHEFGETKFKAGDCLHVRFGAANRDERQFEHPAEIDLGRPDGRRHLGFGSGVHYCLGAGLARSELKIALEAIFDRFEELEIDPEATAVRYDNKLQVRALRALPVRFVPRKILSLA